MTSAPVPFGTTQSGQHVDSYTLATPAIRIRVLTMGGIITHLEVPDRDGHFGDVVLGFDELAPYETVSPYFGCIVGRVGNRIAHGRFSLDGKQYTLATNHFGHHLHGGLVGFDKRIWRATPGGTTDKPTLELAYVDPAGTEGYPGTLSTTVRYTLEGSTLQIEYEATTDAPTPVNLTNHTYFNLKDAGRSTSADHRLQLDCDRYTAVDSTLIPTGEIASVKGTPLDFTAPKPIGQDLHKIDAKPRGYDHNYLLTRAGNTLERCARVEELTTGRTMECWTTEPAVQFYSGNFLDGTITGKAGAVYAQHSAFCLETQHSPDSVNHPHFQSTILRPGQVYRSTTQYRFGVIG